MNRKIRICTGHACKNCGSDDLLKDSIQHAKNHKQFTIENRNCMGLCDDAPNVQVTDEMGNQIAKHSRVMPKDMQKIIESL